MRFSFKEGSIILKTQLENIGILKEIDSLGRICIPKEIRERLALNKKVELSITQDGLLIKNPEYTLVKNEKKF